MIVRMLTSMFVSAMIQTVFFVIRNLRPDEEYTPIPLDTATAFS